MYLPTKSCLVFHQKSIISVPLDAYAIPPPSNKVVLNFNPVPNRACFLVTHMVKKPTKSTTSLPPKFKFPVMLLFTSMIFPFTCNKPHPHLPFTYQSQPLTFTHLTHFPRLLLKLLLLLTLFQHLLLPYLTRLPLACHLSYLTPLLLLYIPIHLKTTPHISIHPVPHLYHLVNPPSPTILHHISKIMCVFHLSPTGAIWCPFLHSLLILLSCLILKLGLNNLVTMKQLLMKIGFVP